MTIVYLKPKFENPFQKTDAEKEALKTAKANYRATQRVVNSAWTKRNDL